MKALVTVALLSAALVTPGEAGAQERPRARDLGIEVGYLQPGPLDAITDVPGVLVGHVTLVEGDSIRTGVTAIRPHPGDVFSDKVPAAIHVANGFGKLTGISQVAELGTIETPIVLTNTLAVGRAADAVARWTLDHTTSEGVRSVNPVVSQEKGPRAGRRRSTHRKTSRHPRTVQDAKRPWASRPEVWAMAGGIVAMALALASFDPYLFTGGDNAHYYALTRALATGRGYVDLVAPGTPPHTQYPPGYPALLVPFYILFDGSYVALKLVSMLAAAALLWATYLVARRDPAVPGWVAAATVWMVGLYEPFHLYAHRVLSDMPFAALAVLALAVLQRAAGEERGDRLDRDWLIGCALAVAAFYVRVAAVALLAAIVAWALLRRHWRRAALAAGMFIAFSLPWFLWVRLAGAGDRAGGVYIEQLVFSSPLQSGTGRGRLGHLLDRLQEIGVEYGTFQLPHLFWPTDPAPDNVRVVGCAVGVGLLALGAWRLLRSRRVVPWEIYVAASLGLLLFWPWLGDRFVLALVPFLWIMMLAGLDALSRRLVGRGTIAVGATAALATALLAAGSVRAIRQWDSTRAWMRGDEFAGYTPFWADYFRAARWIGENAPADAVILARKPTLAWYWSGRHAVSPPVWVVNPDRAWQRMRGRGVTHILLEPSTENDLRDVLHPRATYLSVVHETPRREVVVLEVSPDPLQ